MSTSCWKTFFAATAALALLAGCSESATQQAKAPTSSKHSSPAPVEPPTLPAGSFDQAKAQAELTTAQAAREAGNAAEARRQAEAAVDHWPGDPAAWAELQTDCQSLADVECSRYAAFFQAKIEFLKGLPARAGVLGFQNIAEEPTGTKAGAYTYDERTIVTARRLWAFYHQQDPMAAKRDQPMDEEPSFAEEYPYAPAVLVIGAGAGLLTAAKSLANK